MQFTTRGLLALLTLSLPVALVALAGSWMWWVAAIWAILLGALLIADWRLAARPRDWSAARKHDDRLSLAAENHIDIDLRLARAIAPVQMWLRDDPPPTFAVNAEQRLLSGTVAPGSTQRFRYQVRPPRRGDYAFGDLWLRWQSPFGLLRRQMRIPAAEPVKVYPNLVEVRKYDLMVRRNRLRDVGLRSVRVYGTGGEFERLREYSPDDEYRRINWKATARRGKPIATEFQTERSQNIMILLDVGRMMRSPVGEVAKLDYAINAVLLLTYVAGKKGDKIGLLAFDDQVQTWIAPRSGKVQFHTMLEQLYALEGAPIEPEYARAFAYLGERLRKHSLVLVFTELTNSTSTEMLVRQLLRLRRRHLCLLVTVGDPTVQKLARQPIHDSASLYERTVAEEMLTERDLVLQRLRQAGVLTLDVPADELSIGVINRYLEIKARQMI
jgi:uncharacterized protein (DUF58 family)